MATRARGEYVDDSESGQAALLLTHPLRRWILTHALKTGSVTYHDVRREWYAKKDQTIYRLLAEMVETGWLISARNPASPMSHSRIYSAGNLTRLRLLHAELTELLSLSPTSEEQP